MRSAFRAKSPNISQHFFGMQTLYLSLSFLILGTGLQITLLALKCHEMGISKTVIGLIGSAYFLGYLLGCRGASYFVQGVAHIRTFAGLTAVCVCIALSFTLWTNPYFWMFCRFLTGFCMAGLYVVVESWVNQQATNQNRGHVISQYRLVDIGSTIGAQSLLFFFIPENNTFFTLFAIFLALAIVPITMTKSVVPVVIDSPKISLKGAFHKVPFSLLGCLMLGLLNSSLWALSPVFIASHMSQRWAVPLFSIAYLLGGFIFQKPIGKLSDKKDRRILILVCAALTALATFSLPTAIKVSPAAFWITAFCYGCVSVPIYSLFIALAHDQSGPKDFVPISSSLLFAYGLGAVQGPFYAGLLTQYLGADCLFYYIGGGFSCFVVYGLYRLVKNQAIANQEVSFIGLPQDSSPIIFESDPRAPGNGRSDYDTKEDIIEKRGAS